MTHSFEHKAMKTIFTFRLQHEDRKVAATAANEAFQLIDEVEDKLSRYREGSDVWQINHMEADQTLFISELCYDCLLLSLQALTETMGFFDVTLGRQIEHQKRQEEGAPPELTGQIMLVPDRPAVYCKEPGREIDLGGIGKGFALDRAKALLRGWGVDTGILSAGASTHLAFGEKAWRLGLSARKQTLDIDLRNQSLSASGTGVQNEHILSPLGEQSPYQHPRIWVLHESAAWADAWSTAAMLMNREELGSLANKTSGLYFEDAETGAVEKVNEDPGKRDDSPTSSN